MFEMIRDNRVTDRLVKHEKSTAMVERDKADGQSRSSNQRSARHGMRHNALGVAPLSSDIGVLEGYGLKESKKQRVSSRLGRSGGRRRISRTRTVATLLLSK